MISYELKPTFDNLKKSILEDSVDRNKGIANFIKFLYVVEGNMAVALDDNRENGKNFDEFIEVMQLGSSDWFCKILLKGNENF